MLNFTQSQGHGFIWENEIKEKVFGLNPLKNDTKKYDINFDENKFNQNENISIKTTGNNSVAFADIIRFFNADFDKKYTIILIKYSQSKDYKNITEVLEIEYTEKIKKFLFGSITEKELSDYVDLIKSISHGKVPVNTKKNYKEIKKNLEKRFNMNITINPKVDSKKQRRVQCTISNINLILENFPESVIYRNNIPEIRGIKITQSLQSSRRERTRKSD